MLYQPQPEAPQQTTDLPDGIMEDVSATILNKQGKISMKIVTPKMTHFAAGDITHLESPELTIYRKSPKPWFITSKHAKAQDGIENVFFWESVNIHHPADLNSPATLIKTASLHVRPNEQIAKTDNPITLIQPNIIIKAIGMQANMNSGDIKLLSQSRGQYVPSS